MGEGNQQFLGRGFPAVGLRTKFSHAHGQGGAQTDIGVGRLARIIALLVQRRFRRVRLVSPPRVGLLHRPRIGQPLVRRRQRQGLATLVDDLIAIDKVTAAGRHPLFNIAAAAGLNAFAVRFRGRRGNHGELLFNNCCGDWH